LSRWSQVERRDRTERAAAKPSQQQYDALANGTELTKNELQMLARGLVVIVGWLMEFLMEPLLLNFYIQTDRNAYDLSEDYQLAVCRYILELAENILKGQS
jgi:hypothetical protein